MHDEDTDGPPTKRARVGTPLARPGSLFSLCLSLLLKRIERVPSLQGVPACVGDVIATELAWQPQSLQFLVGSNARFESLSVTSKTSSAAQLVPKCEHLRRVVVHDAVSSPVLSAIVALPHLRSLSLRNCRLRDVHVRKLRDRSDAKRNSIRAIALHEQGCPLDHVTSLLEATAPSLRQVWIASLAGLSAEIPTRATASLRMMMLGGNSAAIGALLQRPFPRLTHLCLPVEMSSPLDAGQFPKLERLVLSSADDEPFLLAVAPRLKFLCLVRCDVSLFVRVLSAATQLEACWLPAAQLIPSVFEVIDKSDICRILVGADACDVPLPAAIEAKMTRHSVTTSAAAVAGYFEWDWRTTNE